MVMVVVVVIVIAVVVVVVLLQELQKREMLPWLYGVWSGVCVCALHAIVEVARTSGILLDAEKRHAY
ncbi:hypothetical protein cyc_07638 [Cyclospora cayetanensis]|uniref:Uncharacterized protein n=1 Tax=Cyclospora cayetanensis TaxID=88456 RepID=A0A1D3CXU2_9EIME|nr:hypothetical protein cyc_07638 [Cyclospora cayetanensis]